MEITNEEFMRIQTEIVQLKTEAYEAKMREDSLRQQLDKVFFCCCFLSSCLLFLFFFMTNFFIGSC